MWQLARARFRLVKPRGHVLDVGPQVAMPSRVTFSPTRSAISIRQSASLLTGVNSTGVATKSRSAWSPLSVSV